MGQRTDELTHRFHPQVLPADERLGLRLAGGLVVTFVGAGVFLLLLLLVESEWTPLRDLDMGAAADLNRIAAEHDWVVATFQAASLVFGPTLLRTVATLLAVWALVHRERRRAVWLLAATWGAALLGLALKELVGRARPVVADPVASAPGMSFPSGHALAATVGCGLLLLLALPQLGQAARVLAAGAVVAIVLLTAASRVGLGVHYVSDVLAGIALGVAWLTVTTWAYLSWRRETGQPAATPADVGAEEHEPAPRRTS